MEFSSVLITVSGSGFKISVIGDGDRVEQIWVRSANGFTGRPDLEEDDRIPDDLYEGISSVISGLTDISDALDRD